MPYRKERPSLESIEFDDERVIMSHVFDDYRFKTPSEEIDYLSNFAPQDPYVSHGMPEVSQVTGVLLRNCWR